MTPTPRIPAMAITAARDALPVAHLHPYARPTAASAPSAPAWPQRPVPFVPAPWRAAVTAPEPPVLPTGRPEVEPDLAAGTLPDGVVPAPDARAGDGAAPWAIDDAGAEVVAIAQQLDGAIADEPPAGRDTLGGDPVPAIPESAGPSGPPGGPAPWADDDWVDIMPVRAAAATAEDSTAAWASFARQQAEREAAEFAASEALALRHADAAATALEGVAQRLRTGELQVPPFQPDMGDAAALAAVLAALLGVRR
jgi:hypothetical protein